MQNIEYREALTQVLCVLEHTDSTAVNKIPIKIINFIKCNCSKEYKVNFDYSKPVKELNLTPKAQAFLGMIYLNYWADNEKKIDFRRKIRQNEIKHQENLREKYNPDNIFKNNNKTQDIVQDNISNEVISDNFSLVECKESILKKIINKIKSIFHIH